MNLVVCVKQVPASDRVRFNKKTGTLIRSDAPGILNPADEAALLMAAALAKQLRGQKREVTVTVLTMGPPQAKEALYEGLAYGADEAVLLCDKAFGGSDTWATSLVLSAALKDFLQEEAVIFTGDKSTDGETGHVGPQTAEHLGILQISGVRSVNFTDVLEVERETTNCFGTRTERLEAELPVILSVSSKEGTSQYLSIGAICEAFEKKLWEKDAAALSVLPEETGHQGSKTEVVRTFIPEANRKGVMLSGSVAEMAGLVAERLG